MTTEEKEAYKLKIIEEIYTTKMVHKISFTESSKRGIDHQTQIWEDVVSHIMLGLMKVKADKLIELYESVQGKTTKNTHLQNYIGRMIATIGFGRHGTYTERHKVSIANNLLFGSTMRTNLSLSPTEVTEEGYINLNNVLVDEPVENKYEQMWKDVLSKLTPGEAEFIQVYIQLKNGQGKKEMKERYKCIKRKIDSIVKNEKPAKLRLKVELTEEERKKYLGEK